MNALARRNFYAKAVTRIVPKVEQSGKRYKRKPKYGIKNDCY